MPDTQPTIPAEAVEAAARAIYEYMVGEIGWDRENEAVRIAYRDQSRDALAAAFPHLPQHVSPSVEGLRRPLPDDPRWLRDEVRGWNLALDAVARVVASLLSSQRTVEQVRRETLLSAADALAKRASVLFRAGERLWRMSDYGRSDDSHGSHQPGRIALDACSRSGQMDRDADWLRARAAEEADRG